MIAAFGDVEAGTTLSQSEELSALLHEALPDLDTETLQLLKKNFTQGWKDQEVLRTLMERAKTSQLG